MRTMTCRPKWYASLREAIPATTSFSKTRTALSCGRTSEQTLDANLTDPTELIGTLETFFSHQPPEYTEWEEAVSEFRDRVPALGEGLAERIHGERETNRTFITAFAGLP